MGNVSYIPRDMDWVKDEFDAVQPTKPKTVTVLGLIALTSLVFSYLGAYAVHNVLVANQVVSPLEPGHDPRPRWMLTSFCVLLVGFMALGEIGRRLSRKDLKAIEAMVEAEDGGDTS